MGSRIGVIKIAAQRIGKTLDIYSSQISSGLKWCWKCREWHPKTEFVSDRTRGDGLAAVCRNACSTGRPRGWQGRRPINPVTGRPGPAPNAPRDQDKKQARHLINMEVQGGRRPHPNALPCADCGHIWRPGERRHEYDHYKGYAAENHCEVQPVCTLCHHRRAREERMHARKRDAMGRFNGQD